MTYAKQLEQSEINNAKRFLRAALKDGPRLASEVMRESRIYEIRPMAIAKASKQIGASGWLSKNGLMWGVGKA